MSCGVKVLVSFSVPLLPGLLQIYITESSFLALRWERTSDGGGPEQGTRREVFSKPALFSLWSFSVLVKLPPWKASGHLAGLPSLQLQPYVGSLPPRAHQKQGRKLSLDGSARKPLFHAVFPTFLAGNHLQCLRYAGKTWHTGG